MYVENVGRPGYEASYSVVWSLHVMNTAGCIYTIAWRLGPKVIERESGDLTHKL